MLGYIVVYYYISMPDRNLHSRSQSVNCTDSSRQEIEIDEDYTCFSQEKNITMQEIQVPELETSHTGILNINDNQMEVNCSNTEKIPSSVLTQNQMQDECTSDEIHS
jgi:hypothetical protein